MQERLLYQQLWQENIVQKPMVLIFGPRQAGKTTFARELVGRSYPNKAYLNWDIISNKKTLIENPKFFENIQRKDDSIPLVILDEIHKYKNWKNYLKGIYDEFAEDYQFIVSGSGRLDLSKRGGESLAGRYLEMHLFPFTLAELAEARRPIGQFLGDPLHYFDGTFLRKTKEIWSTLTELSGFPEPYTKGKKTFWYKWSETLDRQIIREDMTSLRGVRNLDDIEILFSLLPTRVGSPLSLNNLASDIQVSFDTVKQWLKLFDHFYLTFRLSPWSKKIGRSLLKEKKQYLYNYPHITNPAAQFENMVALELLRATTHWNEHGWGRFSLHYLRDKEKREVDFVITQNHQPILLIESKLSDDSPCENLKYFQTMLRVPAVQLVGSDNVFKRFKNNSHEILIITAHCWLALLP